jgi:predicted aldo/keto reductase-like oxidoreductase
MRYRRFGKTNLRMPVFSCGGMRYQFKWQDVPLAEVPADNQANLEETIRRSLELGINHIETARGYGSSERQLGAILPGLPRERMIVQTKIGPCETAAEFTRNFESSLAALRLDYVDLLAVHGINNRQCLERTIRPGGCLAAARAIQQRGLARHVGFSTHGPTDVILAALRHEGDGGFDYVNLHWYYIYQRNWPAIQEATRRDIGVFIISPSDKGGMLYRPPQRLVDLCRPLHPLVFNDLFCLARPEVHTLSIGAARPSDFDLHLTALTQLDRAAELLPPILDRLRDALLATVGPRLANPFALGLPDWEQTPGQINIPIILWLRGLALAYGMKEYGMMRYNLLGSGDHWFPGYGCAKLDQVDLSPVAAAAGLDPQLTPMLREAHQMLAAQAVKRLSQSE